MCSDKIRKKEFNISFVKYFYFLIFFCVSLFGECFSNEILINKRIGNKNNRNVLIILRDSVYVKENDIFLKDLAIINGEEEITNHLKNLVIDHSPKPGKEKKISGRWIKSLVQSRTYQHRHQKRRRSYLAP